MFLKKTPFEQFVYPFSSTYLGCRMFQTSLPSNAAQLFLGDRKPDGKYTIPPIRSGSTSGLLSSWTCPENLLMEAKGRRPIRCPNPHKEEWLYY